MSDSGTESLGFFDIPNVRDDLLPVVVEIFDSMPRDFVKLGISEDLDLGSLVLNLGTCFRHDLEI